jgi:LmbE family N-acetylglucosaminyl deacetylase
LIETVILSPHLDDAILSCWHTLAATGEVAVINVFAAIPAPDQPLSWWDRITSASNSAARMRERLAEDQRALALAGRQAVNLEFLDDQYRDGSQSLEQIVDALRHCLAPATGILAPAGIGEHPDHLLVRAAAITLRHDGHTVALYAELPHAIRHGWPRRIEGSRPAPVGSAEIDWEHALAAVDGALLTPTIHPLSARVRAKKLEAIHAYRTQLDALNTIAYQPLDNAGPLRYEVAWQLR